MVAALACLPYSIPCPSDGNCTPLNNGGSCPFGAASRLPIAGPELTSGVPVMPGGGETDTLSWCTSYTVLQEP